MDTFLFLSSYCYPCGRNENNNDFPGVSDGKVYAYNVGDPGSTPGSGRSPGEGNGNPLQYSCQENLMDGEAWSQRVGHD